MSSISAFGTLVALLACPCPAPATPELEDCAHAHESESLREAERAAGDRVEVRRPAAPDARIEIQNMAGSTRVVGWDRPEVEVTGALGRGAEGVEVAGKQHRIRVEVQVSDSPNRIRSDLEVHVPTGSRVEIDSHSADVTVSGVTGSVHVESVAGSITVTGGSRDVHAETVGGTVTLSLSGGASSRIHAESVNGAVTIHGGGGDIEANTVTGNLTVDGAAALEHGHLETVSGGIRFEGVLAPRADLQLESVSGSLDLLFPGAVSADFEVSTFSGSVENELGPEAHKVGRYTPEKELSFTAGAGGARVSAKTLSGSIHLRKR